MRTNIGVTPTLLCPWLMWVYQSLFVQQHFQNIQIDKSHSSLCYDVLKFLRIDIIVIVITCPSHEACHPPPPPGKPQTATPASPDPSSPTNLLRCPPSHSKKLIWRSSWALGGSDSDTGVVPRCRQQRATSYKLQRLVRRRGASAQNPAHATNSRTCSPTCPPPLTHLCHFHLSQKFNLWRKKRSKLDEKLDEIIGEGEWVPTLGLAVASPALPRSGDSPPPLPH